MVETVPFPKMVDDPLMIFMWQADEFIVPAIGLAVGLMVEQVLLCTVGSFFLIKQYKKFKDDAPRGLILHMAYWYGFMSVKSTTIPKSFTRYFYS